MNYNIDTEEGMANAVRWMEQTLATPSKTLIWRIPRAAATYTIDKGDRTLPGLEWTNLQIGYFYTWALP